MNCFPISAAVLLIALSFVAACSSVQEHNRPIPLFSKSANETSKLRGLRYDTNSKDAQAFVAFYDHEDHQLMISQLVGIFDHSLEVATFRDGSRMTFDEENYTYVRAFSMELTSGQPYFGVLGHPTNSSDIPNGGSAQFFGQGELVVVSNGDIFDLDGDVELSLNFGNKRGNIEISRLIGVKTDQHATTTNVSLTGKIGVNSIKLDVDTLRSSSFEFSVVEFPSIHVVEKDIDFLGTFFGEKAKEFGGVLVGATHGGFYLSGTVLGAQR